MTNSYSLQCGDWSCSILPDFGCNVISLRHQRFPILREPQTLAQLSGAPVRYGLPILFPPNRTEHGTFTFDGAKYYLPINESSLGNHLHGSLHSTPFEVVSFSKDTLQSRFSNHTEVFPFPFVMEITDQLTPDGFYRSVTVTNNGEKAMPLTLGFHTAFTAPPYFSVPIGKQWLVNARYIPTGIKEEPSAQQLCYRDICHLSGQKVSGFFESAGSTAQIGNYRFSVTGFDQWILFNGDGQQGFLCVEPQLGPVNSLNSGGFLRLEPGQKYTFYLHINCIAK